MPALGKNWLVTMPLRQSGLVVLSVYNIFGNVRGALVEQRQ